MCQAGEVVSGETKQGVVWTTNNVHYPHTAMQNHSPKALFTGGITSIVGSAACGYHTETQTNA